MVTRDQLIDHNRRRPFAPFWVKLHSGETIYVMQANRAVVSPSHLVYTPNGVSMRRVRLDEITGHGTVASSGTAATGSGGQ